jgi:hypothetical protein
VRNTKYNIPLDGRALAGYNEVREETGL